MLAIVLGVALAAAAPANGPLRGYTEASSRVEREWEAKFRAIPDPARLREYMKRLTARPHHLGSPYGKDNAEWLLAKFKEWGFEARIEVFEPLFPTPKERALELLAPVKYTAKLDEPAVSGDPTSAQKEEQIPTYNAYSADGDVTAPLVYVNYGLPEDYDRLARFGVSVKGAIVITRYGGGAWRGLRPKVAAEHGAAGCIIYSDPRDDGYFQGDVFPKGAYRPSEGVQRGSVMEMTLYPGDPLTPGAPATAQAKRLALKDAPTLTKIPVLPISYGDAQPLLAALEGPVAPPEWRGALPITYHIGPGPARVHLKVASHWDTKPLYNVIARIPGAERPDEWVLRGNHHDAWVNGADDPTSALAAMLEEARAMGVLITQGWRPKRTIVFCAWDGEEQGLLGSTEWVEAHAEELTAHAVAYINSDANGRGFLQASGSHTLEKFLNGVAKDVDDPETSLSVWKRLQLFRISSPDLRQEARDRADLRIHAPGSGSDYTAFIDHLGIPSLHLSFEGEDGNGIYHSIYDDFYWFTHHSDTDFRYGRALAQTAGTAILRLANADLLPHNFTGLADTIRRYNDELHKLLKKAQDDIAERNREIDEGVFAATADPKKPTVPPAREAAPPALDFSPLDQAADSLAQAADRYEKALGAAALERAPLAALNRTLMDSERRLTDPAGLPGRPWFKHLIYAPGVYSGYGAKTIPGVREAVEQKRWAEAQAEIGRAAKALQAEAGLIDHAAATLAR